MNCGLIKNPRFVTAVKAVIKDTAQINSEDQIDFYIENIKELRKRFPENDFYDAINSIWDSWEMRRAVRENSNLGRVLSQNKFIEELLKVKIDDSPISPLKEESKSESLDENAEEKLVKDLSKLSFLAPWFPFSTDAMGVFVKKFKENIIQNLFIDKSTERHTFNVSDKQMNDSIISSLLNLEKKVDEYIKTFYSDYAFYKLYKLIRGIDNKIKFLKNIQDILVLNDYELSLFPGFEFSDNKKLEGYYNLVAFLNFDDSIRLSFGDALDIKYHNKYSTELSKYSLNLGNRNARTWGDDDASRDSTNEIGSIIRLYVESLNVFRGETETKEKLSFDNIKKSIGDITKLLERHDLEEFELTKKDREVLKIIYGENGLNYIEGNINKNPLELIALSKLDPVLYAPFLFYFLNKRKLSLFKNNVRIVSTVNSLYENIFNPNRPNSLLNISLRTIQSGKLDFKKPDLYSFFLTLFVNIENTPYMQYRESNEDGILAVNITKNSQEKKVNNQKYDWNGLYNIKIPLDFETFTMSEFEKDSKGEYKKELTISIKDTYILKVLNGKVTSTTKDGKVVNLELKGNEILLSFLSEVFGFKVDDVYLSAYTNIVGEGKLSNLIRLAGNILYNYKVGKTINAKDNLEYDSNIKLFYNDENIPQTTRDSFLPELFSSKDFLDVYYLVTARDVIQGFGEKNVGKDGEGKQIALLALSSLMGKFMELATNYNKKENSITSHFKLYDLFKGIEFVRDFNGLELKRQATQFSHNEFYGTSFIYDFYGGYHGKGDRASDYFIRIFGPVVSDKNKLPKILISVDDVITINGEQVQVGKLTSSQIYRLKQEEFGIYYKKLYENIKNNLSKLTLVMREKYGTDFPEFNYDDDFEGINNFADGVGKTGKQLLHEAIALYLRNSLESGGSTYDIKMIDGVSYIANKDGSIHNNPALFHLLSIFGVKVPGFKIDSSLKFDKESLLETPEEAITRQNNVVASELLSKDIEIVIGSDSEKASHYAKSKNKGFILGHHIVIGKINGENIITSEDFENLRQYRSVKEDIFQGSLPSRYDVSNPGFDLNETINLLNWAHRCRTLWKKEFKELLPQEFLNKIREIIPNNSDTELLYNDYKNRYKNWDDEKIKQQIEHYLETKAEEEIQKRINNIVLNIFVKNAVKTHLFDSLINEGINIIYELANDELKELLKTRLNETLIWELNPEIERHNALNTWIGEAYNLATVGSFIAHPGNRNSESIFNYEAFQIGQLNKRNVSQTAIKHREVQNTLTGIGGKIRQITVEDESNSVITFKGDYDSGGANIADGAMYYNPLMDGLDNNSLGSDAMGSDKKPFVHSYDVETGIGFIGKMAGFVITNSRIRKSRVPGKESRFALMNRIMNDTIKWSDIMKLHEIKKLYLNYLSDTFHGNPINIDHWFYYDPANKCWMKAYDLEINEKGETIYKYVEVYRNGEEKNNGIKGDYNAGVIDSNYLLWKVFGGENSASLHSGKLEFDDSSIKTVGYIMNNIGFKATNMSDSQVLSQSNVILVLKESMIHMWSTLGANKYGPANINSLDIYTDEKYVPTWMEYFSSDYGDQQDSEHEIEGSHVSLMTLVVNALGARGYSRRDAQECYDALESIILSEYKSGFEGLENEDPNQIKLFVYNLLAKALNKVEFKEGNILTALSKSLKDVKKVEDLDSVTIAISDPRVFSILTSKVASAIEKAVRLKMDGGQNVLVPSDGNILLVGEYLSSEVSISSLKEKQKELVPLKRPSEIRFGRNYIVNESIIRVDSYQDFESVKNAVKSGIQVKELLVKNDKAVTRDLSTYECIFYDMEGNSYSLWETDAVRMLHHYDKKARTFNEPITHFEKVWNYYQKGGVLTETDRLMMEVFLDSIGFPYIIDSEGNKNYDYSVDLSPYLRNNLLKTLNSIGTGTTNIVSIDGLDISVDKSRTEIFPYEAILPMMYKSEFGLEEGDKLLDIVENKNFFVERALNQYKSKLPSSVYDLELKVSNGNHIYIHDKSSSSVRLFENGRAKRVEINDTYEGNIRYRVINGKKAYPIPEDLEIYEFRGVEIFSTSKISELLDTFDYDNIILSNRDINNISHLVLEIANSENEIAVYISNRIVNTVKLRIKNHKEGLSSSIQEERDKLKILKEVELEDGTSLADAINSLKEEDINNVDINWIINSEIGINELIHSDLISKNIDTESQLSVIEKFIIALNNGTEEDFISKYSPLSSFLIPILNKGRKKHTSFLTSLEAIVSRTPAQSHQSFMAMKIVGFGEGTVNSIYVSRMLLYLQGSDYDIDKANVLGLKFINGLLVTWSPYFDLRTKELEKVSENLPFPTGLEIEVGNMTKRAFDVNDKNYIYLLDTNDKIIIRDSEGNIINATKNNGIWNISGDLSYTNTRAIVNKINKIQKELNVENKTQDEANITINGNIQDNIALGIKDGKSTGNYDYNEDFKDYIESIKVGNDYPLSAKVKLLRTAKELRIINPDYKKEIFIINKHNTYLKSSYRKRYALYNFISIKTKNISKDPVNLILGQTGVDVVTKEFKDKVAPGKGKPEHTILSTVSKGYDAQSVISKISNLILTLSGKLNTGIVASAMKTFEAMSQYFYNTLATGTEEQLLSLLSDMEIMGKQFALLANSYTNNIDNIKHKDVEKALKQINNIEDAFILMSALLSLSTDNAKDPTLSKYNAGPNMIGIYTAGIIVGVDMDTLRDLALSKTGLLLNSMTKTDILNPKNKKFKRLSQAIDYLNNPPTFHLNVIVSTNLKRALDTFGLSTIITKNGKQEIIDKDELSIILRRSSGRRMVKMLASFLLNPSSEKITKTDELICKLLIKEFRDDPSYWKYKKSENENNRTIEELKLKKKDSGLNKKELKKLEKLESLLKEYNDISYKIEILYKYLDDNFDLDGTGKDEKLSAKNLISKRKDAYNLLNDEFILNSIRKELNSEFKTFLKSIFDWSKKRDIIEKDRIRGFKPLSELKKLNDVNEEMGELRKVLALNQGLPNLVLDQLNWIRGFLTIIETAVTRKGLSEDSINKNLEELIKLNGELKEQGIITFDNPLWIDLDQFLNNPTYQEAVVKGYGRIKVFVNIMDVMLNVSHYRGYLKAMNLLYESLKTSSVVYKEQTKLGNVILPKLNIKFSKDSLLFFKDANSLIFKRLNDEFLFSKQVIMEVPDFSIIDGNLKENQNEKGEAKTIKIKLGTELGNKKFVEYMLYYIYPFLKKAFPNNEFVKLITRRTYKFNLDHNISINIAKSRSFNLENVQEHVSFNLAKRGLLELQNINGVNITKYLFYYNLIAYNGLPGQQALTDLFEDIIAFDKDLDIRDYKLYLAERDKSGIDIFSDYEYDELIKVLAPTISAYSDSIPFTYFYVLDAQTKEYKLCQKKIKETSNNIDPNYDPGDYDGGQDIPEEFDDSGSSYVPKQKESWFTRRERLGIEEINFPNLNFSGNLIFNGVEVLTDVTKMVEFEKDPLKSIKANKEKILLAINGGKTISLLNFIDNAKMLGWKESECLSIFKFLKIKRGTITYNKLDLDILLSGLKSRSEYKQENCNG